MIKSSPVLKNLHGEQPDVQNPYETYRQLSSLREMLIQFGAGPKVEEHLSYIEWLCQDACKLSTNVRGGINDLHAKINPDMIPEVYKKESTPNTIILNTMKKYEKALAPYSPEQIQISQNAYIGECMAA